MPKRFFADNANHRLIYEILGDYGYTRVGAYHPHELYFPAIPAGFRKTIETLELPAGRRMGCVSGYFSLLSKRALFLYLLRAYSLYESFQILPPTFILEGEKSRQFLLDTHSPGDVYLLKKNLQLRKGIELVHDPQELTQITPQDGYVVVQKLIPDVFQLDHRKLHLRLYIMLECFQGRVTAYCHDEGVLQYAAPYSDPPTFENSVRTQHPYEHESNLPFTISELTPLLDSFGYDLPAARVRMEEQIVQCLEAVKYRLGQSENLKNNFTFQLYGIDFIFNFDMKPYLLEFNLNPLMEPREPRDRVLKTQIYEDFYQQLGLIERDGEPQLKVLWEYAGNPPNWVNPLEEDTHPAPS